MIPCQNVGGVETLSVMPMEVSKAALLRWMSGRVEAIWKMRWNTRVICWERVALIMNGP